VGSYYYLAAQLPTAVYGQAAPMSPQAFRDLAKPKMGGEGAALDLCVLDPLPLDPKAPAPPFVRSWYDWEGTLRGQLARSRAQALKREGGYEAPESPADAAAAAKAALALESPLEAEQLLDRARWGAVERFAGLDAFSENAMYAYLLKLLLCERGQAFKTEEGFAEYKALYASILGAAEQAGATPMGETK